MNVNPYEPNRRPVDETPQESERVEARPFRVGLYGGSFVFVVGILWIKFLQRIPNGVGPVSGTVAQSIAYGGMAIALVSLVALSCDGISRLADHLVGEDKTAFSWNTIPSAALCLIGTVWCGLAASGLYMLTVEQLNYDYYRGLPVLEVILQSLLYCSGLVATVYCLKASRQWMRRNWARGALYGLIGLLGPILAYVMLFRVCEVAIRYIL